MKLFSRSIHEDVREQGIGRVEDILGKMNLQSITDLN
jgi:hypothetical protein